jgi:1-aminocyclopropane-1-carboxylate deaminase
MMSLHLEKSRVDTIPLFSNFHTKVDVLRLDLVHPAVSGNKWFKLKYYLDEARQLDKCVATFGGAYSNHIVATAAAAAASGLRSIGLIRGERPTELSCSLRFAQDCGMELFFLSREDYREKKLPPHVIEKFGSDVYLINEGGLGEKGVAGAREILKETDAGIYTHIVAAVGTGTTLAGLIEASAAHQQVMGISVFKNNLSLENEIRQWLSTKDDFILLHDYHFGGYARHDQNLIEFMNEWFHLTGVPSDFVYTGKLFFAIDDLVRKNHFPSGSRVLVIHSGGLQGNCSLPKGTLIF